MFNSEVLIMADKICVYGTRWCHDTIRARNCLERLGVDYKWFDVDEDRKSQRLCEAGQ